VRALAVLVAVSLALPAHADDVIRVHPADGSIAPPNTTVVVEWRGVWGAFAPSVTLRQLDGDRPGQLIPVDVAGSWGLLWLRPRVRLRSGARYAIDSENPDPPSYSAARRTEHRRLSVFTVSGARDDTAPAAPRVFAAYRGPAWGTSPWSARLWLDPAACASPSVLYAVWRRDRRGGAPAQVLRPFGARLSVALADICDDATRCEVVVAPIDLAGNVGGAQELVLDRAMPIEPDPHWDDWNRGAILCDAASWYGVVPTRPDVLPPPPPAPGAPRLRHPRGPWLVVGACAAFTVALVALALAHLRRRARRGF
jgi:hypothetical protein